MGDKILVVAPHPDDETLGCGGTLLKHAARGDKLYWMIMTEMDIADGWPPEKIVKRQRQIDAVAVAYGFAGVYRLGFPAARLDAISFGKVFAAVADALRQAQPGTVYLPDSADVHSDHRVCFDALWGAAKTFRSPFVRRILSYETPSETEFASASASVFQPNVFIDMSAFLEKKLEIMKIYDDELMPGNMPRSLDTLRSLASLRGSRCGAAYAEAFHLYQEII
jgi:LmbE family N-acetylglucosaminyl deacetylase